MNRIAFGNTELTLHCPSIVFSNKYTNFGCVYFDQDSGIVPSTFESSINNIYDMLFCSYSNSISSFESQSTVSLVSGSMTSGLYYNIDHSTLSIFRGEREAYNYSLEKSNFKLNTSEIISSLISHQLCINSPFQSLDKSTSYLPPSTVLSIDKITGSIVLTPLILLLSKKLIDNAKSSNFEECLKYSLKSILKISPNIDLLFSGGLDSSIIFTYLRDMDWHGNALFKDYNALTKYDQLSTRKSQYYYTSKVAKMLSIDLKVLKSSYDGCNAKLLVKNATKTSKAFTSIRYLPFLSESSIHSNDIINYQLTGQNADTLYQLDTFAPSTEALFLKRIILNVKACSSRLQLLVKIIAGRKLNIFFQRSKFLQRYQCSISNLTSFSEHSHFVPSTLVSYYIPDLDALLESRQDSFDIVNYLAPAAFSNFCSQKFDLKLKLIRYYRTIQNSARNIYEIYLFNRADFRIMPFMYGPLLLHLMLKRYRMIDIFFPKSTLYRNFYLRTGFSFRSIFSITSVLDETRLFFKRILTRHSQHQDSFDKDKKLRLLTRLYKLTFERYDPAIYLPLIERSCPQDPTSTHHFLRLKEHVERINSLTTLTIDPCLDDIINLYGERYLCRVLNMYIFLADLHSDMQK